MFRYLKVPLKYCKGKLTRITLLINKIFPTAAFVFNWVGFVLLLCFCHTVAGRTGALAGFGLSLAKWAAIVRNSTDLVADSNTWLLWLIMALGEAPESSVGSGE